MPTDKTEQATSGMKQGLSIHFVNLSVVNTNGVLARSPSVPDRAQCTRLFPAAAYVTSVPLQRFLPFKLWDITCQWAGVLYNKGQYSFPKGAGALDLPELWWDIHARQSKNDIRGVKCQVLHLKRLRVGFPLNWLFPYTVSADMVDISVYNPISIQQAKDSKLALKRGRKCQYLDRKLLVIRWKHECRSVSNIFRIFDRNIWLTLTKVFFCSTPDFFILHRK